jgi:hypothetical protein
MLAKPAFDMLRLSPTRLALLITASILCSVGLGAQSPQLRTRNGGRFPTVVFNSVLWSANPSSYSLAVDSTGAATYQSTQDSVERTGVPYTVEFQASDATRRMTFNIVRQLNFLSGDFPTYSGTPEKIPVRTLAYHDITYDNRVTYSESSDSEIQELTSVFEEISATFEFARRLSYLHQHDKERIEPELIRMQTTAERHMLRELQAATPALKVIALDKTLTESVRKRAEAILALMRKS